MLGLTTTSNRHACMPQICHRNGKLLGTPPALHHKGTCLRFTPSSLCHVLSSRGASTAVHASVQLGHHAPLETSSAHHFRTLLNKKISLNPFATFSEWISRQFMALDLGLAASQIDSLPASVGLATASGVFIATKCDVVSIALRGVFSNPSALFLQDILDPLPGSIVALFLCKAKAEAGEASLNHRMDACTRYWRRTHLSYCAKCDPEANACTCVCVSVHQARSMPLCRPSVCASDLAHLQECRKQGCKAHARYAQQALLDPELSLELSARVVKLASVKECMLCLHL
eukprot:1160032-Pelagomonas_calceolata.AAC.3